MHASVLLKRRDDRHQRRAVAQCGGGRVHIPCVAPLGARVGRHPRVRESSLGARLHCASEASSVVDGLTSKRARRGSYHSARGRRGDCGRGVRAVVGIDPQPGCPPTARTPLIRQHSASNCAGSCRRRECHRGHIAWRGAPLDRFDNCVLHPLSSRYSRACFSTTLSIGTVAATPRRRLNLEDSLPTAVVHGRQWPNTDRCLSDV